MAYGGGGKGMSRCKVWCRGVKGRTWGKLPRLAAGASASGCGVEGDPPSEQGRLPAPSEPLSPSSHHTYTSRTTHTTLSPIPATPPFLGSRRACLHARSSARNASRRERGVGSYPRRQLQGPRALWRGRKENPGVCRGKRPRTPAVLCVQVGASPIR